MIKTLLVCLIFLKQSNLGLTLKCYKCSDLNKEINNKCGNFEYKHLEMVKEFKKCDGKNGEEETCKGDKAYCIHTSYQSDIEGCGKGKDSIGSIANFKV